MMTIIRSITELMVITTTREHLKQNEFEKDIKDTLQVNNRSKKNQIPKNNKSIKLPSLPKTERRRWTKRKEALSKFLDELDYNNQIQSTYDLTLIDSQKKYDHHDAA
tara:strand:- start:217 stop:537 length:321 start_codon:yes stop_codon:yes gene_type:complete